MVSLEGGVNRMALKSRAEAVDEAVARLLDEENTIGGDGANSYSRTVFSAFEKIRALREKRVSFERICRSFETSGMLPENANLHSFRQAYLRERARRSKAGSDAAKKAPLSPARPAMPDNAAGAENAEKERARKLAGTVVNTGTGKIIKHADGSFEY
jgi:hypothetical protein